MHDALKNQIWREKALNEKPIMSWIDAGDDWMIFKSKKKSLKTDAHHMRLLAPFVEHLALKDIDAEVINQFIYARKNTDKVNDNTINRSLALLRSILYRARDNKWIEDVPTFNMLDIDDARDRFLSKKEAKDLLSVLPDKHINLFKFTLATGLRESNLLHLRWNAIDFDNKTILIRKSTVKNKTTLYFPLNEDAINVLKDQLGKHNNLVFPRPDGKIIKKAGDKAWKKALKKAEIEDFRWHDLRHTWASWHVQNGTTLLELQKLGGWKTYQCVLRYAHLTNENLRDKVNNVNLFSLESANSSIFEKAA
jgi:integrase